MHDDLERAGLIKVFEFCFEFSWKAFKNLPFHEGHDVKTPRDLLRKSCEVGYIDGDGCETMLDALKSRNILSHAYRSDMAREVEA